MRAMGLASACLSNTLVASFHDVKKIINYLAVETVIFKGCFLRKYYPVDEYWALQWKDSHHL